MRIVWMSDHPSFNTGYARVTREVVQCLAHDPDYEIAVLGWHDDQTLQFSSNCVALPGGDDFGRAQLPRVIDQFRPDVVVALGDLWTIDWIGSLPQRYRERYVAYFPLDNHTPPSRWSAFLHAGVDAAVAYSRFAAELLHNLDPSIAPRLIYHGVDPQVFTPIPDKEALHRHYCEQAGFDYAFLQGKFVVGCVARNQPRKGLPILIKAFARFAIQHPDAMLMLHTAAQDEGWDIPALVSAYGLEERCLLSDTNHPQRGVTDTLLNLVYNLFDVFALPTMGEGFGLPVLEAMACGVPVIATDCTSLPELVRGRGELIAVKEWMTVGFFNAEQAIADGDHLLALLNQFYDAPSLRDHYGRAGRAFAETLTWSAAAQEWKRLFAELAANPAPSKRQPQAAQTHYREMVPAQEPGASPRRERAEETMISPTIPLLGGSE